MVVSPVNPHVKATWHVAIATEVSVAGSEFFPEFVNERCSCFSLRLVHVMVEGVVFIGPVTLGAQGIPLKLPLQAVRIVTVAAANIFHVHLALGKRAVFIVFILELPVDVIGWPGRQLRDGITQKLSVFMVIWPG